MDPQANLKEQRMLAARIVYQREHEMPVRDVDVARLTDLVIALDNWIMNGGFLPADWQKTRL